MSLNTVDTIFLTAGLVNFFGIFIWFGIALYLSYTHMESMLISLKNCSAITRRTPLKHFGPVGRLLLFGGSQE